MTAESKIRSRFPFDFRTAPENLPHTSSSFPPDPSGAKTSDTPENNRQSEKRETHPKVSLFFCGFHRPAVKMESVCVPTLGLLCLRFASDTVTLPKKSLFGKTLPLLVKRFEVFFQTFVFFRQFLQFFVIRGVFGERKKVFDLFSA